MSLESSRDRRGRYRARHRIGGAGLVHCRMLMAMAAALRARKDGWRPERHDVVSVRRRTMQVAIAPRLVTAAARAEAAPQPRLAA